MNSISKKIRRFLPRVFHAYCIGCAKTGTTSIADIFKEHYRSAHEIDIKLTNDLIINYLEEKYDRFTIERLLLDRDKHLKLEMESSNPLTYISPILSDIFPNAKFIITIREPYSWLESRINYHYLVSSGTSRWVNYKNYFWWKKNQNYHPEEAILKELGLCCFDTYLSQYAQMYQIAEQIPENKRIIVKTSKINQSISEIADFLHINPHTLKPKHSKKQIKKQITFDNQKINVQFVREKLWFHCENLIVEYFPETLREYI